MLSVAFKYVGHGDCILLEWEGAADEKGLGIIDCNAYGASNPVVDRLRALECVEIDFILLSHPHHDHFSGMKRVLEYCDEQEVRIGQFYYTVYGGLKDYLRSLVLSHSEGNQLADLFRKMRDLYDQGIIGTYGLINNNTKPIPLSAELSLQFLAPSQPDIDHFLRTLYDDDFKQRENAKANLLSTIIAVGTSSWHVLLTADVERKTLKGIGRGPLKRSQRDLVLGQVPHHGSPRNHYPAFWRSRNYEKGKTPLGISAGPNPYGHPDAGAMRELAELGYVVSQTGEAKKKDRSQEEIALDLISTDVTPGGSGQDLVYEINGSGAVSRK